MRTIILSLCLFFINNNVWAQPCTVFTQSLPQFCSSDPIYDLTNVASPSGGTWTGTGVTGNNLDPSAYPIPGNYSITYTYIDIPSSCTTVVNVPFTVISCCPVSPSSTVYIPAAGASSSGLGLTNVVGTTITVEGDFVIDNTVTFANCIFEIRADAKIIVQGNSTSFLTLNTCQLYSCGNTMWDGILVKPDGSLTLRTVTLEDAKTGVYSNGINATGIIKIENSIFNKNYIHTHFDDRPAYDGFTKFITITNTDFRCEDLLNPYSFNGATLEAPFAGQRTLRGVWGSKLSGVFYIGDLFFDQNEFYNSDYGIDLYRSDAFIENNYFERILGPYLNVYDTTLTATLIGVAINGLTDTGKQSIQISDNRFIHNTHEIRIKFYPKVFIEDNFFDFDIMQVSNLTLYACHTGIYVANDLISSPGLDVNILNNQVYDHDNSIIYYISNQSVLNATSLKIENNHVENDGPTKPTVAINVGGNIPNTGNISGPNIWTIKNNDCFIQAFGIRSHDIKGPVLKIESNIIKLRSSNNTPGLIRRGIDLFDTRKVTLFDNRIHGTGKTSAEINHVGIYCFLADQSNIKCNWLFNIGTSLRFQGAMPSSITGNRLMGAFDGITMGNSAVIGPQGNSTTPSDNRWLGVFNNSHTRNLTTNCNIHSPYYLRLNPSQFFPTDNEPSSSLNRYIYPSGLIEVFNPPSPINCPNLFSPFGLIMSQIAKGKISMAPYDTTAKWISKRYVYESAMIDTALQNDFSIDSMMNSSASVFYNDLTQIENYFGDGDYLNALSIINSLIPTSQPEATYKLFYGIYGKFHNGQSISNNDCMILDTIAFACPFIYGDAVLQCRSFRDNLRHNFDFYPDDCDSLNDKSLIDATISKISVPNLNVYPNPSSGIINLTHNLDGECILEIYDLTGKIVQKQKVLEKQIQINLSEEQNGVYFFKFSNSKSVINKKLILSK